MQQGHGTRGLRLLSLDGGGIRGLSELVILKELLARIQAVENLPEMPLPCEYFDMIAGTSTGGLIAIMLGRLRMSVQEAIDCYGMLSERVFGKGKKRFGDGKYKASALESVIKDVVGKRTGHADERMMDMSEGACKVFVTARTASNLNANLPALFRTYRAPRNASPNCTIWEAARATSAAPTFFKPIRIADGPGVSQTYIDGGFGINNPCAVMLTEAQSIFADASSSGRGGRGGGGGFPGIACVVSIGTGAPHVLRIPPAGQSGRIGIPVGTLKALASLATDCEAVAQEMTARFADAPGVYFRFNVEQGMHDVKMAEWEKLEDVSVHTSTYVKTMKCGESMDEVVRTLRFG